MLKKIEREKLLLGSLGLAYGLFALTFRGPRTQFWNRMMLTGATLGGLSLKTQPRLRKTRIGPKDVGLGLASAAGLYVVFQIGDRIARVIMPKGASEIDDIYALRRLGNKQAIAARLVSIIGPAEELYWRGVVQHRLMELFGKPLGAVLGTAAYGGAHLVTGNFTLIGAASVAGGYWGALYALGVPTGALIVSHAAWDVFIFLIAPTVAQED
jgi:membrane protease YdiL (CAAX protease family)